MHASKTISSKPNKQIKNSFAYLLQILFLFKTWELIWHSTERLKTMLASPVYIFCISRLEKFVERLVVSGSTTDVYVLGADVSEHHLILCSMLMS